MSDDDLTERNIDATATKRFRGKILVSINSSWNIVNFRSGLVKRLIEEGFEVIAASQADDHVARIERMGCRHIPLEIDSNSTDVLGDCRLLLRYISLMRAERPFIYLGWTIKPNVYGSLAARFVGVPAVNNVSGLGTAFLRENWLTRVVKFLYRTALRRSSCVFFQNRDDCDLFLTSGLVRPDQARVLPGSGIDLGHFAPAPLPIRAADEGPVFILVARVLWDKGVREYVDAARLVMARAPGARFRLLGFLDVDNPVAVPRETVNAWVREGVIEYLGHADDVRPHISSADCVVLPSYREGTPRSLLEAAALARPIITTDVPGCREVVDDGINGWLCKVKDASDLAKKMMKVIEASRERKVEMGILGRLKVEREYNENIVIEAYLDMVERCLDS